MTSDVKLGTIIGPAQQRDAIHIAIAPVVATRELAPGQEIDFVESGNTEKVGYSSTPIGIVDPFLKNNVRPGQRFWMFLFPNTVTSLRHEWEHPRFAAEELKHVADSVEWLTDFAREFELTYSELVDELKNANGDDDYYFHCGGFDTPDRAYQGKREMWHHFEIVTGIKAASFDRVPFSCAC